MKQGNKLTNKQQVFIEYYLQCWNASEAARRAGYTGDANTVGPRLLANVGILEEVQRRLTELKAGADEVVTRLTSQARGSMEDIIDLREDGSVVLDLAKAKEGKRLHLIKKLKTTRKYLKDGESEVTNEIELYDTQAALVQMGRVHGLFNDKLAIDWREKVKQAGHDPDELFRHLVETARSRQATTTGGSGTGSDTASADGHRNNLDADPEQSATDGL